MNATNTTEPQLLTQSQEPNVSNGSALTTQDLSTLRRMSANQARLENLKKARAAKKLKEEEQRAIVAKYHSSLTTPVASTNIVPTSTATPSTPHPSSRPTFQSDVLIEKGHTNYPREPDLNYSFERQQQVANDLQRHQRNRTQPQQWQPPHSNTTSGMGSIGDRREDTQINQIVSETYTPSWLYQLLDTGKSIAVATLLACLSFGVSELFSTLRTPPANAPAHGTKKNVGGTTHVESKNGVFNNQSIFR